MIVAIEGIDAAGKKTICAALKEALKDDFGAIETFDFPHYQGIAGGLVGRVLRGETIVTDVEGLNDASSFSGVDRLKQSWSKDKALLIQCAMLADRCEFADRILPYADDPYTLLILDRYYLSGIVYGQPDGLPSEWLEAIHSVLPKADRFFVLDIPVEESVRRRPERQDYYEKNLPKLRKVRELYQQECSLGHAVLIDGLKTPGEIVDEIEQRIRSWM